MVVLGEVETGDPNRYEYIFAAVREGSQEPTMYVTSEKASRSERGDGSHRLRVIMGERSVVLGVSDKWKDLDQFAEQALDVVRKSLMLTDEPVKRGK